MGGVLRPLRHHQDIAGSHLVLSHGGGAESVLVHVVAADDGVEVGLAELPQLVGRESSVGRPAATEEVHVGDLLAWPATPKPRPPCRRVGELVGGFDRNHRRVGLAHQAGDALTDVALRVVAVDGVAVGVAAVPGHEFGGVDHRVDGAAKPFDGEVAAADRHVAVKRYVDGL